MSAIKLSVFPTQTTDATVAATTETAAAAADRINMTRTRRIRVAGTPDHRTATNHTTTITKDRQTIEVAISNSAIAAATIMVAEATTAAICTTVASGPP